MKKIITIIVSILAVIGLCTWGIFAIVSSSQKQTSDNIATAQKTITELKKLPEYKDVAKKNWDDIISVLKQSKDQTDFESNYDWYLGRSLQNYNSEKKLNLISLKTLDEKIAKKENFVVFYSQSACPHCENLKESGFSSEMQNQIKSGKHIYLLNLNIESKPWLDSKYWIKSKDVSKTESGNSAVPGTPAIGYFKQGKFNQGYVSEKSNEVKKWLSKLSY